MKIRKIVATAVLIAALNPYGSIVKAELYGSLIRTDNTWRFSKIATDESGPVVSLSNKKPVNYSLGEYPCSSVLWGPNGGGQCHENGLQFRETRIRVILTALHNLVGPIALMPLLCGFITHKTSYFDHEKFDKAVDSACKLDNVEKLLSTYDLYIKHIDSKKQEYDNLTKGRLSNLYDKYNKAEQEYVKSIKVSYVINDLTGFWPSTTLPEPELRFTPAKLDLITVKLDGNFKVSESPSQFAEKVKSLKAKFDAEAGEKIAAIDGMVRDYERSLIAKACKLNLPSSKNVLKDGFDIRCDYSAKDGSATPELTAKYTIKSRNWHDVFPKFTNKDENIEVNFDGKDIKFSNKTNKFLEVSSISVYYNSEVFNVGEGNRFELPPETQKVFNSNLLLQASNIAKEARYIGVNQQNSINREFSFGFAVKYRSVDQNIDKTLYKVDRFNLFRTLSEIEKRS